MAIVLTFHGAARQVTGSCFLLQSARCRFLVHRGMFQGLAAVERNAGPLAFDPRELDFVRLTHAHVDHSGLLPRLAADGFTEQIYARAATADLLAIMLPDSAYLQQMATERAARTPRPLEQGPVRQPIYSLADVATCLRQFVAVPYDAPFEPKHGVRCQLRDAGHVLGSAIVELWIGRKKPVFSGDLGQPGRPIVRDAGVIECADVVVVESTHGNRDHQSRDVMPDELVAVVNRTLDKKRGNVIVPSFAVRRTRELLYFFAVLSGAGRPRNLRIFVDSPMATRVTEVTAKHFRIYGEEAQRHFRCVVIDGVSDAATTGQLAPAAVKPQPAPTSAGPGHPRHAEQHPRGNAQPCLLTVGSPASTRDNPMRRNLVRLNRVSHDPEHPAVARNRNPDPGPSP